MRAWRIVVIAVMLASLAGYGFCIGSDELKRNDFPVVLMYHDIKTTEINGFDVSVKDFRQQLDWLVAHEYKTLSIDEFADCLIQNKRFPEKSVLITFDDGYDGIYTYAAPDLRQRGMKATFFVIKDAIGKRLPGYDYLTERQVIELSRDPLFSIQPHTLTHADLTEISSGQLQHEVEDSKKFFEGLIGKPCRTIAFPYGHYNASVLAAVEKVGYDAAFSVTDLGLYNHESRYSIPRIYMGAIMGKDDMKLFRYSVVNYKNMPPQAFKERFGPLD